MEFLAAMERTALILVLALTLPLAFYGVPYAYATSVVQTMYVVRTQYNIPPNADLDHSIQCLSASDSALHYGAGNPLSAPISSAVPLDSAGDFALTGENPNGWFIVLHNTLSATLVTSAYIICQTPITIAGISVPEFGSLYVAIALSAVVYFFLARRNTATKPANIRPN